MPTNRYFEFFPVITYGNNQVVDITKRVALLNTLEGNTFVYVPYEISENERPDQFSYRYYEDPFKSWILYLSNKVIDPYYEWYLQQNELDEFCQKKYGDSFVAQQKIKYYHNDYVQKEEITTAAFEALPSSLKVYWEPVYGMGTKILSYKRREVDWKVNTNKIISYVVNSNPNTFTIDEICDIVYEYSPGTGTYDVYGKAQVLSIDTSTNTVYMQHVSGNYATTNTITINANSYIYGTESESNTKFTDFSYVANNIPEAELSYWKAVSYYEYENDKNEYNKTINVLEASFSMTAADNLRVLMTEE